MCCSHVQRSHQCSVPPPGVCPQVVEMAPGHLPRGESGPSAARRSAHTGTQILVLIEALKSRK